MVGRPEQFKDGTELLDAKNQGENLWGKLDWVGEQKRDDMIAGLKEFQDATGRDESEYIAKIAKCKSNAELDNIEKKTKHASIKWYKTQLHKSGLFVPMHTKEGAAIDKEMQEIMKYFSGLPLTGEHSMISRFVELNENMQVRAQFRNKLKSKSKFVKEEFFRRLGSIAWVPNGKEALLSNIMKELKGVEDSSSAEQYEFKKKQKGASAYKDTHKIKEEVEKGYKTRKDKYVKGILDNQANFGGKKVQTPYGKIPKTAWEFIQWFEEQGSFAKMDSALKKLPSLVKQRERLYKKRDKILEHALPADKKRLTEKTNLMRRHELEGFLPELNEHVRRNSMHVAEFMATILGARTKGIALFQPFERTLNIRRFKLADVESQKARLKILNEDIKDRARVVDKYFSLPSYLRNDENFLKASEADREKMLNDSLNKKHEEKDSPFKLSTDKDIDGEDTLNIAQTLRGSEGQRVMDDIAKDMQREGALKAAEVQNETYKKIFGTAKRAERHNETQKESYLRDLKYWVKLDQNVKDESDVTTDRQESKFRYIQAADEAYDKGYVMSSGGQVDELQTVNARNIQDGTGRVLEQLNNARYGEHVMVEKKDGEVSKDPLDMIEDMSQAEVMKLVLIAITKLGGSKHLSMGSNNLTMLRNSRNIQKEMSEQIIDREFDHLKMAA